MKESSNEGLTNHIGPESCVFNGNGTDEALTGVCAGWVLSPERLLKVSGADVVLANGRQHCTHRYGKGCTIPAGSETPLHAQKHHIRESGGPMSALQDSSMGRAVNRKRKRPR